MGKKGQAVILSAIAAFFCAAKVALSETIAQPSSVVRDLRISDLIVSPDVGYVIETHEGATTGHTPILIHIQEAHANYEGQQHLVKILEQLVRDYGLRLILVEGGEGDVGLSYLRRSAPVDHRKRVAERYLKAGLITAEEYLDLVSDVPLTLWGVEEPALYQQSLETFLSAESLQQSLLPLLTQVRTIAERLQPTLFAASLTELETKTTAFDRQEISLADYVGVLERVASQAGTTATGFPNLERLFALHQIEQTLERPLIQQQQRALLAKLSARLSQQELDALLAKGQGMRAGTVQPIDFSTALQQAAAHVHVEIADYPELSRYLRYVDQSAQVVSTALAGELEMFVATLRTKLATTPQSQQLREILDALQLIGKLVHFDLSPEEYRQLQTLNLKGVRSRWETFLNTQLQQRGEPVCSLEGLETLEEHLPRLQAFYELAHERDEALVTHTLEKIAASGERLAVLITGGFHSAGISAMLKAEGVSTVAVVPKVSHPTDERLYRALVRYKTGNGGSFEEVMALTDRATERPR